MNDIQVGRYSAILHKLLGISEGSPAPTLAPELLAAIALEVDRPEWAFLAGERLCIGYGIQAAVGGQLGHVQLINPIGSGVLAVVQEILVSTSATMAVRIGQLDTPLGGASASAYGYRERRLPAGVQTTACDVNTDSSVGSQITTELTHLPVLVNVTNQFKIPWVLSPGTGVCVRGGSADVQANVNYVWTERAMEPAESR